MEQRVIGDRRVSALGFGCWAIGGPFSDTADVYGAGHSERVLGRAVAGHRDEVVIASKWGNVFDERTKVKTSVDVTPEYMRTAIRATLTRLGTDYLDLYQLH